MHTKLCKKIPLLANIQLNTLFFFEKKFLTPIDNKTTWSTWPTPATQHTKFHKNKARHLDRGEVWISGCIVIDISILEQPWQTVNNGTILHQSNNNDHYLRLIMGLQNMLTSPTQRTISHTNHSTTVKKKLKKNKNGNKIPNSTKFHSISS